MKKFVRLFLSYWANFSNISKFRYFNDYCFKIAFTFFAILLISAGTSCAIDRRLFVLSRQEGVVNEFSISDFEKVDKICVKDYIRPKRHFDRANVIINRDGEILYWQDFYKNNISSRVIWLYTNNNWDRYVAIRDGKRWVSKPLLSEKGSNLFWYENRYRTREIQKDKFPDLYIKVDFDLFLVSHSKNKQKKERIVSKSFNECRCATGECTETCPVGEIRSPNRLIGKTFRVDWFIGGQLGSSIVGETLFAQLGESWQEVKSPIESGPQSYIEWDDTCCGWSNRSSDRLLAKGVFGTLILYDEFKRFHNDRFDVNFSTSHALFSPDNKFAAFTINKAWISKSEEIRLLSSDKSGRGFINVEEKQEILKQRKNLPMIVIKSLSKPSNSETELNNSELIGWIDNQNILLVRNGKLSAFNLVSKKSIKTNISAGKGYEIWLL